MASCPISLFLRDIEILAINSAIYISNALINLSNSTFRN